MKLSDSATAAEISDYGDGVAGTGDEAQLISLARQGDEGAWKQLLRLHQEPVFRLAYLALGDEADAADIAQEAFIRAHNNLNRFDESRPFRPWLLSISSNLARNRRRSIGRYWAAVQRFWQANPQTSSPAQHDKRMDDGLLWSAVHHLRPQAQEVIYLRYYLELSEAETAETLGVPPGTVKSRLHRALKQLRQVIEKDFPELAE